MRIHFSQNSKLPIQFAASLWLVLSIVKDFFSYELDDSLTQRITILCIFLGIVSSSAGSFASEEQGQSVGRALVQNGSSSLPSLDFGQLILPNISVNQLKRDSDDFTVQEATDPLLIAWSLAAKPQYYQFHHAGGSLGYVQIKSVATFDLGIPVWTRLQWAPFEMDDTTGPTKAGVGDLTYLILPILEDSHKWGRFGLGPVFVFPTASHPEMGQQAYQVGPAFGWSNKYIEGWQFAMLGQEFLSYAGSKKRTGVDQFQLQPFVFRYLPGDWFLGTQPIMTIDFEKNTSEIPVNFTIGKLFSHKLNMSLETNAYPYWTNTPKYNWDVRLSISYIFRSPL
jgi:hypothetical protein